MAVLPREGPTLWKVREYFKGSPCASTRASRQEVEADVHGYRCRDATWSPTLRPCCPAQRRTTCRCACCGTLLRNLRWHSICDCTRTPNQVAQRRAYAGAAMSGLAAHLLQLQDAPIWEIGTAGLTHYVNLWKVVPLPLARSERAGAL